MEGLDIGACEPVDTGMFSAIRRMSSIEPRPRCDCTTACCCTKAPSVVANCVRCCSLETKLPKNFWFSGWLLSLVVLPPRPPLSYLRCGATWFALGARTRELSEWCRTSVLWEGSPRTLSKSQHVTEEAMPERLSLSIAAAGFKGVVEGVSERDSIGNTTTVLRLISWS